MSEALPEVIEGIAGSLPAGQLEQLASRIERCVDAAQASARGVVAAVATPVYADKAGRLLDAWERCGEGAPAGTGISLALRAAALAAGRARQDPLEVVWTGPNADQPVRLTAAVVDEVIGAANERLTVLSFAAYEVDSVLTALQSAVERGVAVDLVLETSADSGGKLSFDVVPKLAKLDGVVVWHWPASERPPLEKGVPSLHAKAIVADARIAFVTSANLTGYALAYNIELGLVVRDVPAVRLIEGHVRELMARNVLQRIAVDDT